MTQAELAHRRGTALLDETDTQQTRYYAEILRCELGTLTVKGPQAGEIVGKSTFDRDGRRIIGVIGRDIIADSLVFGFDRERASITLTTLKALQDARRRDEVPVLAAAQPDPERRVVPLPRRLVEATIGGLRVHAARRSRREREPAERATWAEAKLRGADRELASIDEVGMPAP